MPSGFFLKKKPPPMLLARARLLWFRSKIHLQKPAGDLQIISSPWRTIGSGGFSTRARRSISIELEPQATALRSEAPHNTRKSFGMKILQTNPSRMRNLQRRSQGKSFRISSLCPEYGGGRGSRTRYRPVGCPTKRTGHISNTATKGDGVTTVIMPWKTSSVMEEKPL